MINEINKEKTCAITGHRDLSFGIDKERLEEVFISLINRGYNTFLIGMAIGFDSLCFKTLELLRETFDIKLIACVPCLAQSKKFSSEEKLEYDKMICSANKVIVLSEKYTPYCMLKRNVFMVDNASILVAYVRKNSGGSVNTLKYAEKKDLEIIRV